MRSFCNQSRIPHRISEEGEFQVVWVDSEAAYQAVVEAFQHYERGEYSLASASTKPRSSLLAVVFSSPLTVTLILANLICFPATLGVDEGEISDWLRMLTLLDLNEFGNQWYFANPQYTVESNQWWRFVTPMLLHFGWIHIVFNLLWVWEIGRRIEQQFGALLLLALVVGVFNRGESGPVLYVWCWIIWWYVRRCLRLVGLCHDLESNDTGRKISGLPAGIYIFMLLFLVLGFTGAIDLLGLGNLANGAHLGGLVAGVGIGLLLVGYETSLKKQR